MGGRGRRRSRPPARRPSGMAGDGTFKDGKLGSTTTTISPARWWWRREGWRRGCILPFSLLPLPPDPVSSSSSSVSGVSARSCVGLARGKPSPEVEMGHHGEGPRGGGRGSPWPATFGVRTRCDDRVEPVDDRLLGRYQPTLCASSERCTIWLMIG